MSDADSAGSHGQRLPGPPGAKWREFGSSLRQLMHFLRLRQGLRSQRRMCRQPKCSKFAGRKRKASQQRPAATAAASPDASGSTPAAPPAKPSFADVVAGRTTPEQTISILIGEVQRLTMEVSQVRAFGTRTYDKLQQEKQSKQSSAEQLEHLHRHSKRNNLTPTGAGLTKVRSAFRLGKWKQDQGKPRAVLVELLSVAAKHTAFQASKRLRAVKVRLDEGLTPHQMQTRRGLSTDFQWLKACGYKPFFRGITLRYGPLIRKCARGEANKVMAAAAQAARATAPPPPRQQQAQEPRVPVAMDPSVLLHQHGISLDRLSDPSNMVAQAAQAVIDVFDSMMHASGDDVAS
ncbi:TPA: hypothetical protein ACH3X1_002939 [Trebouxia sp. C0004]